MAHCTHTLKNDKTEKNKKKETKLARQPYESKVLLTFLPLPITCKNKTNNALLALPPKK